MKSYTCPDPYDVQKCYQATNTFRDPEKVPACVDSSDFQKCYTAYKATYGPAAATEFAKAIDATSSAQKLVATAKEKSNNVVNFFHKFEYNRELSQALLPCIKNWNSATANLGYALSRMQRKMAGLEKNELLLVRRYVDGVVRAQSSEAECSINQMMSPSKKRGGSGGGSGLFMGYSARAVIDEAKRASNNALHALNNQTPFYNKRL